MGQIAALFNPSRLNYMNANLIMRRGRTELETDARAPVIVAGTGPVGLIAALALARLGLAVTLVGPENRPEDGRTTALMHPALAFLDEIGVLSAFAEKAAPLKVMRIVDATSRLIRSPVVTFRAAEIGQDIFGLNVPNLELIAALAAAVAAQPGIVRRNAVVEEWAIDPDHATASLSDGTSASAAIVVAADGRLSPAREAAGISVSTRAYPQSALVLNFTHARDHAFTSTEFHTETGPFTQVPLPGSRSSLVWVVSPETASQLSALDDATLSRRVEDQMQSMLGRVSVTGPRQIYPLTATLPHRFALNRVALTGEAAHVFPPIGAQGLNLSIRDVSDLIGIISVNTSDPGSTASLAAYDRKRRPDILARAGAVNLLNMSLLSDMLPAQLARGAGLGMIGGFGPLRTLFMREGLNPGSGFSSMFSGLREKVRR